MTEIQLAKFLDFINIDLSSAPQPELMQAATFVVEVSMLPQSRFGFDLKDIAPRLEQLLANDGALLKEIRARLQAILTEIADWSKLQLDLQHSEKPEKVNVFESLHSMKITAEVNLMVRIAPVNTGNVARRDRDQRPMGLFPMSLALTFQELETAMVFHLLSALEELDANDLKICPICRKWFLQQTKREKLYCSNSCAAKSGNRKRYMISLLSMVKKSEIDQ